HLVAQPRHARRFAGRCHRHVRLPDRAVGIAAQARSAYLWMVSAASRTEQEVQSTIERLQRAEEDVRRLQDELIDAAAADRKTTMAALKEAVTEGLGEGEGVEAAIALVPLAEVLGELDGPDVCDLLVELLGAEEPEVRFIAGRAL